MHDVRREDGGGASRQGRHGGRTARRRWRARRELILTSLPGPTEVEAVAIGADGDHPRRGAPGDLRRPLHRLAHRDAEAPRRLQGASGVHVLDAPVSRRRDRRRARNAAGDGRRRRGHLSARSSTCSRRSAQGRLHGVDRRRHHRQARAQHDQPRHPRDHRRGLHARREGRRQAGGAARGGPRRLVRPGQHPLAHAARRGVHGRLRHAVRFALQASPGRTWASRPSWRASSTCRCR